MILLAIALAVSSAGAPSATAAPEWTPYPYPTAVPTSTPSPTPTTATTEEIGYTTTGGALLGRRQLGDHWDKVANQTTFGMEASFGGRGPILFSVHGAYSSAARKNGSVKERGAIGELGAGVRLAPLIEGSSPYVDVGIVSVSARKTAEVLGETLSDHATATGPYVTLGVNFEGASGLMGGVFVRRVNLKADLFGVPNDVGGTTFGIVAGVALRPPRR